MNTGPATAFYDVYGLRKLFYCSANVPTTRIMIFIPLLEFRSNTPESDWIKAISGFYVHYLLLCIDYLLLLRRELTKPTKTSKIIINDGIYGYVLDI